MVKRLSEETSQECARCKGREHGDCSNQCFFFFSSNTASPNEQEVAQRKDEYYLHSARAWSGPTPFRRIGPVIPPQPVPDEAA